MLPNFLPTYLRALRSYKMTTRELMELQGRKLRRVVAHAYRSVPQYRASFKASGIGPEDIRGVEDLPRLPLLRREEVVRGYPVSMIARGMRPSFIRMSSGTTTGTPLRVEYSQEFLNVKNALYFRRLVKIGVRPWHRLLTVWDPPWRWRTRGEVDGGVHKTTQFREIPFASFLGHPIPQINILRGNPDANFEARRLLDARADFVFCRPTHLRRIGVAVEESGLKARVKGLICSSEGLTSSCAADLRRQFGATAYRLYGGSEGGSMGSDCSFASGIHLNEDYILFEVLKDGEPVSPGEMGQLVITHLHNPVMPLIRFPTGDCVVPEEAGRCQCGSSLRRLRSVQGRVGDWLLTADGRRVPPLETADAIEHGFGFRDFQVVQESPSKLTVRIGARDLARSDALKGVAHYLRGVLGSDADVTFERRNDLSLWSKARPVVNEVGRSR